MDTIIRFEHVDKVYPNGTKGLKDVNFSIRKGDFVALIGLSGSGKSTMLRTINQLIPIESGKIFVEGQCISKLTGKPLRMFRRRISMVFQNFNLVKNLSVLRNVLVGRLAYNPTWKMLLGLFSEEDKAMAYDALKRVNMEQKIYSRADELSGGQQQRVAIARALVQNPIIILADEPVASLDPVTTQLVMEDLKRINQEMGITVLVSIHSVELARRYADRMIGLRDGELVFDDIAAQATDERLRDIYGQAILQ